MGIIRIENIKIYSNHGCLEEEKKIGSHYRIDVELKADLSKSAKSDRLSDTVDYVMINKVVKEEMSQRSKLLENVVIRILHRLLEEHSLIDRAKVAVSKISPPIGGDVDSVRVEMMMERKREG